VPQPVVDRLGDEQGRRRIRDRRPGDLGEDHAVDPVRVIRRQRVADDVSGVVADHGEPLVTERIHQLDQVAGEGAAVVPLLGLVG
jgi:hypothetical protein